MSEITIHPRRGSPTSNGNGGPKKGTAKGGRRPNYNAIHRNLLPVDIHPLPTLIPHNPLSIVTIALSYLIQVLAPPKRTIYTGYFSSATSSIHITEEETQRALWEQGFFGRGSLSRSEPTWLETQRRAGSTAEENTDSRRQERRQFKIERARAELNAMEQDMAKGSELAADATSVPGNTSHSDPAASLPIPMLSTADVVKANEHDFDGIAGVLHSTQPPLKAPDACAADLGAPLPPKLLNLKEDDSPTLSGHVSQPTSAPKELGGRIEGFEEWKKTVDVHGLPTPPPTSTSSETSQNEQHVRPTKRLQRQKTVRFSPTIEAREFDLSSPVISPIKAPGSSPADTPIDENKALETAIVSSNPLSASVSKNQEHLQISLEEAFFLSYALGVLEVLPSCDADTPMPTTSLLSLFRRHSYFPARSLSIRPEPDDPFLLSYAAYHHYRSMGWVVRSGVKFGVDYLLYNRGPAFSHAEFAVIVLPSYRDGRERETKNWWWLHGINRVQAQVHKSLVLCYVDVPDMMPKATDGQIDIGETLALYKVRDVNVRRWTPNRNRD